MNAVNLYVSIAKIALQLDTNDSRETNRNDRRLQELNRQLPQLRQLLSCAVCSRILNDPFAPRSGCCQHNVCRLCVSGKKSLQPPCFSCANCVDFKSYEENLQMRCLLLCFKSMCEHLMASSTLFGMLCNQNPVSLQTTTTPSMSAQEIVLEGASIEDIFSSFKIFDPPRPAAVKIQQQTSMPIVSHISNTHVSPLSTFSNNNTTTFSVNNTASQSPTPSAQLISNVSTPPLITLTPSTAPPLIKLEPISTIKPATIKVAHTISPASIPQTKSLTLKHLKNIVELAPGAVQFSASTAVTNVITTPRNTSAIIKPVAPLSSITYMTPQKPGIVVPVISSSATTAVPLTIASAKLQSLTRQLANVRNLNVVSVTTTQTPTTPISTNGNFAPLTLKISAVPSSTDTALARFASTTTTTSTMTTLQQIRNPPPIKTVSNGSAMYSVLYTGIGNKITIKRKTNGDEETIQRKNVSTSVEPNTVFQQMYKPNQKRRGCRCGNATATPGKLTCCGQRCPCYVDSKSCVACKCRGCRNPHRPDGGKVRPVIPELACYEIQMADDNGSLSPTEQESSLSAETDKDNSQDSDSSFLTAPNTIATLKPTTLTTQKSQLLTQINLATSLSSPSPTSSSMSSTSSAAGLMLPYRTMQQLQTTSQQLQPQQRLVYSSTGGKQFQLQSSNVLQLENLQRESVLIQNADGNYQVVNLITTGASHNQTLNNLQQNFQNTNNSNSSSSTRISNLNNTFIMPSSSVNSSVTLPTTATSTSAVATAPTVVSSLPQIIVQQQQQTPIQRYTSNSNNMNSNLNTVSVNLHQQQFKQFTNVSSSSSNNIITLHPITSTAGPGPHLIPMMNASSVSLSSTAPTQTATRSLNTIYLTKSNTFAADMFSDSSEELVSMNSNSSLLPTSSTSHSGMPQSMHLVTVPPQTATTSPLSLSEGADDSSRLSTAGSGNSTMIEIIETCEI